MRAGAPKKKMGLWWKIPAGLLGAIIVLSIIGAVAGGGEDTTEPTGSAVSDPTSSSAAPTPSESTEAAPSAPSSPKSTKPTPAPVKPKSTLPPAQTKFVSAVTKAQTAAEDADNDLQRGSALSTRNKTICDVVGRGGRVSNWVGEVSTLDANGEGKGILSIEVADDVHIETWNNFVSDTADKTLIEPGPLFDKVLKLEEGQKVKFSGKFVDELGDLGDSGTCANDSRLTLDGKLTDPAFIFRFSDVSAID